MSSPIEKLESFGLGMPRAGAVILRAHERSWTDAFAHEARRIAEALAPADFQIHHVGSTSIPGIHAKPILDLLLVAPAIETVDEKRAELEALGYECKGEYGIPGRRYCVLYDAAKEVGYAHLHAFAEGSEEAENHLLFRDYLRAHPGRAQDYRELKVALAGQPSTTREAYTSAKAPLILEILQEARRWKDRL